MYDGNSSEQGRMCVINDSVISRLTLPLCAAVLHYLRVWFQYRWRMCLCVLAKTVGGEV